MNTREATLERQNREGQARLVELGDLRPSSLSIQYGVCGTTGCRCKASPPEKQSPYYYVSYTRQRKSSTKSVKQKDVVVMRKQLHDYERMKLLMGLWIDLATELSALHLNKEAN
jgi:hypothetical protein